MDDRHADTSFQSYHQVARYHSLPIKIGQVSYRYLLTGKFPLRYSVTSNGLRKIEASLPFVKVQTIIFPAVTW